MASVVRLQHTSVPMPIGGHDAARRFYRDLLAMPEIPVPGSLAVSELVWFAAGDSGQEIHCFEDAELTQRSNRQHLCLDVDDLEGVRQRATEHGYPIEETTAIVNRPRFFLTDPFGNLIEVTQIGGDYR